MALLLLLGVGLIPLSTTHAQFLSQMPNGPQLELEPHYPAPGERFTVRFADYNYSSGGTLRWYLNGTQTSDGDSQTVLTLTAPELGKPLTIEARLTTGLTPVRIARATVVPSTVDLIIEGDTTAPYFYAGRRVPSVGSRVRLIGIPHIFTARGERIPASSLSYSWTINNELYRAGRGDQVLETQLSSLGDSLVTLRADSSGGEGHYERTFSIDITEPSLLFYPVNPLTGMAKNAVQDRYLLGKDEVTVRAEPYFMAHDAYQNAQYGWTIDQVTVANGNADPEIITLRKTSEGSTSEIGFALRNLNALSQYVSNLFQIQFE